MWHAGFSLQELFFFKSSFLLYFQRGIPFFITLIITNVCIAIELILAVAFNPIRFWVPEFKQFFLP